MLFFIRSFKTLIDIATTLAFLTAPVLAWLIHRSMHSNDVPAAMKPGPGLTRYSVACVWALTLFFSILPGLEYRGTDLNLSPLRPDNEENRGEYYSR